MKSKVLRLPVSRLALVLAVLVPNIACAWSNAGHEIAALIAWRQLKPQTRAEVVRILRAHPRWKRDFQSSLPVGLLQSDQERWLFGRAAVWPDLARDLPQFDHDKWHFVNEPIYLDKAAEQALKDNLRVNLLLDWTPDFDEGIQNAPQTVDRALKVLRDPAAKPEDKALYLTWLFHVVGDLHQPLHTVALFSRRELSRGDHGGNGIEILRAPNDPKPQTLHALWDRLHGGDLPLNQVSQKLASILAEPGMVARAQIASTNLSVAAWLREGQQAARQAVYTPVILDAVRRAEATPGQTQTIEVVLPPAVFNAYVRQAGAVASERVAIAGYRLARLLTQTLKQ